MSTGETIFIIILFTIIISVFLGIINRTLFANLFGGRNNKTWFCTLFFFLMYAPGLNIVGLIILICCFGIADLKKV